MFSHVILLIIFFTQFTQLTIEIIRYSNYYLLKSTLRANFYNNKCLLRSLLLLRVYNINSGVGVGSRVKFVLDSLKLAGVLCASHQVCLCKI